MLDMSDLEPRSMNDLDLWYIGSCTHLVNCIYQLWHHRLKQFLKYPLFYLFFIQKHTGPNLTLPQNRSRSTQGHHLNKFGSTRAPDAAYQVSRSSVFWFRTRRFFKVFTIYGQGGQLGPLSQWGVIWNLASIGQVVSKEKMFETVDIHTYIHTYTHTDDKGLAIL